MLLQSEIGFVSVLQQSGPVSKVVLSILLVFSVWSWGIILSKALLLRKIAQESEDFWKIFRKGKSLSEISTAGETLRFTPLVPVFNSGVEVLEARKEAKKRASSAILSRTMQRASVAQLTLLESRMTFLATTASVAPFIGLFGTVWGVMTAFMALANADSASIKAVGPGIADALITTAFGLFAAVPAVIAYNQFVYRLRGVGSQLDDLQSEMLDVAETGEGQEP